MSVKWPNSKIVEHKGVNFITQVITDAGCIFNKIDGSNDIGTDAYLEFVESGVAKGFCIGVQIKSGDSNLGSNESTVYFKSDKSHFEYWRDHILEIAGLVYVPSENKAYWINVKEYLEKHPTIIAKGPYQIPIDKENVFSVETFQDFYSHFKAYSDLKIHTIAHFGQSMKLFASDDQWQRFEAIKSLFYYHRNHKETWFYLLRQLGFEQDHFIQFHLIRMFIHIVPLGDLWLHTGNIVDSQIEKYAKAIIKKSYGLTEIKILLSHLNDAGFTRGQIGRHFPALIEYIPDRIECLKKIILDKETDDRTRYFAGILIIFDLQFYDIERAVNFAQSMISNFPQDEEACERFQAIKETLEEGNSFDIY